MYSGLFPVILYRAAPSEIEQGHLGNKTLPSSIHELLGLASLTALTPPPPLLDRGEVSLGGRGDSYYEYLLKYYLFTGSEDELGTTILSASAFDLFFTFKSRKNKNAATHSTLHHPSTVNFMGQSGIREFR